MATINNFFSRIIESPRFKALQTFASHPTIWRIAAIVVAAAVSISSGGIAPLVELIATFTASLISVIAKTIQIRNFGRLKLQRNLLQIVNQKTKLLKGNSNYKKAREALGKIEIPTHIIRVSQTSTIRSFMRTARDIGLENIAPVALAAVTFNIPGAIAFISSLVWGITRITAHSVLGSKTLYSEFKERQHIDWEESIEKSEINRLCKEADIAQYKNFQELLERFKDSIVMEELLKIDISRLDNQTIKRKYDEIADSSAIREIMGKIPQNLTTIQAAWRGIRPWGDQYRPEKYENLQETIFGPPPVATTITPRSEINRIAPPSPTPSIRNHTNQRER